MSSRRLAMSWSKTREEDDDEGGIRSRRRRCMDESSPQKGARTSEGVANLGFVGPPYLSGPLSGPPSGLFRGTLRTF
eukprot:4826387-Pyramimonas_sp.AAC.1